MGLRACFALTVSASHPYFGFVPSESSGRFEQLKQFEDSAYEDEGQSQCWTGQRILAIQELRTIQQQEDLHHFSQP